MLLQHPLMYCIMMKVMLIQCMLRLKVYRSVKHILVQSGQVRRVLNLARNQQGYAVELLLFDSETSKKFDSDSIKNLRLCNSVNLGLNPVGFSELFPLDRQFV